MKSKVASNKGRFKMQPLTNNHLINKLLILTFLFILFITLPSCSDENEGGGGASTSYPTAVYVWVTTTERNGGIGGPSGADSFCESESSTANLPSGFSYTHRAVLATNSTHPRDYITDSRDVQRPDGTPVADDWADFMDVSVTLTNSIQAAPVTQYWTGFATNGNVSSRICNGWGSSNSGFSGGVGAGSETNSDRFRYSWFACNVPWSYLCVSY